MTFCPILLNKDEFRSMFIDILPSTNRTLEEYANDLREVTGNKDKTNKEIEPLYNTYIQHINFEIDELYKKYLENNKKKPKRIEKRFINICFIKVENHLIPICIGYILGYETNLLSDNFSPYFQSIYPVNNDTSSFGLETNIDEYDKTEYNEEEAKDLHDSVVNDITAKHKSMIESYIDKTLVLEYKEIINNRLIDVSNSNSDLFFITYQIHLLLYLFSDDKEEVHMICEKLYNANLDDGILEIPIVTYSRNLKRNLGDKLYNIVSEKVKCLLVLIRLRDGRTHFLCSMNTISIKYIRKKLHLCLSKKIKKQKEIDVLYYFFYYLVLYGQNTLLFHPFWKQEEI